MRTDGAWANLRRTWSCATTEPRAATGGIVFGSDTSGGIRNVYVHSCIFEGTDVGIRLKSTRGRGGVVERLWFENIDMAGIRREAIQITTAYRAWMGTTEGKAPTFRDISFRNIDVAGAKQAMRVEGLPEAPIKGLRLQGVHMKAREGIAAAWVEELRLDEVSVQHPTAP